MTLDPEKIPIIEADIGATLKTIAGAGTGKTSVLVERYLRFVLDDGIPPSRLLALTFTIKAASEMRHRIFQEAAARRRGGILREIHNAWIMNFHQFSYRLIKESAALFGVDPGGDVAGDLDLSRVRRQLYRRFESGEIDGLPDDLGDLVGPTKLASVFDRWMDAIAEARGTMWTPGTLVGAVRGEDAPAYRSIVQAVAALWTAYEDELRRRNLIDFSDMLRLVVWGLREKPSLRERYVGRFDHILVDEFQDTNEMQNELLRVLSGGAFARVTVVGDDKQSIYRWRDARIENLREFAGAEHFLRTNHRSTQNILDLAHYFIVSDPYFGERADEIRLEADRGASDVPVCIFHPEDGSERSYESEARALAAWILSVTGRLREGASPFSCYRKSRDPVDFGDVAILMRAVKRSDALRAYEEEFRRAGIPYAVSGSGGSLEVRALEGLRDLLRVVVYPEDVEALLGLLEWPPFLLPDAVIRELFDASGGLDADAILAETACGSLSDAAARESCARLRKLVGELRVRRPTMGLSAFVSYALEAGSFYYGLFDGGADERLVESVLKTLFDMVDRLEHRGETNLAAFIEALEVLIGSKGIDEGRASLLPAGRVRVMTIHAAKGLQFPAVAVPAIQYRSYRTESVHVSRKDGLYLSDANDWERGVRDSDTYASRRADHEQEERCLLYVAFTRARDHLFVSSPCPNGVGKEKKAEGLFRVVLQVLKTNGIPHEELRNAPPDITVSRDARSGEAIGHDKDHENSTGRDDQEDAEHGENIDELVNAWWTERERVQAVASGPRPAPEIDFVTWRRLRTFAQCPAMYYYRYVAGMAYLAEIEEAAQLIDAAGSDAADDADGFQPPRGVDRKTFGSFAHRLLFEWMSAGASPENLIDDVARRFGLVRSLKTGLRRDALGILDAFAASTLAARENVEQLEVPVEARLDGLVFRGTIDRIDRGREGDRIIDYKGITHREEYEYQVRFYAWILERAGRKVSNEAALCYLTRPVEVVAVDVSPGRLDEIERDARLLEEAVAGGRFEPAPGGVCEECAFNGVCPKAAARGTMPEG